MTRCAVSILQGDCRQVLGTLEDKSVDTCVTSPPYFRQRCYDHKKQIGLEETLDDYLHQMVQVFNKVKRVLKSDGTLWINIGDTQAGRYLQGGTRKEKLLDGYEPISVKGRQLGRTFMPNGAIGELLGVPWKLAFALQADGWILQQDIVWNKTNAMPTKSKTKCTPSHEYIFLFSQSENYYFDYEAIQEPAVCAGDKVQLFGTRKGSFTVAPLRRKRSVWSVATTSGKGKGKEHSATYSPKLIEPCILAGCPEDGVVLDPFGGAGTTGAVALQHNRNAVLIELNPDYAKLAKKLNNAKR